MFVSDQLLDESLNKNLYIAKEVEASCSIEISDNAINSLMSGALKISIKKHGTIRSIQSADIYIGAVSGRVEIYLGANDAQVRIEDDAYGKFDLRLWRNSKVHIGKHTSSNGVKIVCANSEFMCGEDCMFSDEILIQTADQHGIVDLSNNTIINNFYKKIVLGNHVWLGRRSTLTSSAGIGDGSVIGIGSIVTNKIPDKSLAVGVPAIVKKNNISWTRYPDSLDGFYD